MSQTNLRPPSRLRFSRSWLAALMVLGLALPIESVTALAADSWSDSSGQFQIEADFMGVEGRSVVLKKPDGSTVKVPIDRLSADSRQRAKALYQASQASAPALSASSADIEIPQNDFAPEPPAVSPMPAFPENASLQQSFDFMKDQLLAGHPEVFWAAMPTSLRQELDSSEFREASKPYMQLQEEQSKLYHRSAMKICELLIKKKDFFMKSVVFASAPPEMKTMIGNAYDPAVGSVYELLNMLNASQSISEHGVSATVSHYAPRIGGHLKGLADQVPPQMKAQFLGGFRVDQASDTEGSISFTDPNGKTESLAMQRYEGRWIPQPLVEKMTEHQGQLAAMMNENFAEFKIQSQQANAQAGMMMGMMAGMVDQLADPMLKAATQQEFDAELTKLMMMAAMMQGGNGGPGLAPAPAARNPAF